MSSEPSGTQMRHDLRDTSKEPLISVIVALYNAEPTLSATLDSFRAQTIDSDAVEYLIVNDGSDDGSLDIAMKWAEGRTNVVVVDKPNGGIASTRNEALRQATGKWVTSVDPDDLLEPHYFEEVRKFILADTDDSLALLSSRVMITRGETGRFDVSHPLDGKFRKGNRAVDLRVEPNSFAIGATTFFLRSVAADNGIEFDERVAPSFEDGNFLLRYLCHFEDPILGLVSSAHYYYRRIVNGNSAVQSGWSKREKYVDQVKWGYLGAIRHAERHLGETPDWMAVAICYDLMYYFKEYHKYNSLTRWVDEDTSAEFMRLCRRVFRRITIDQLKLLKVNAPNWSLLQALRVGFKLDGTPARLYRWGRNADETVNFTVTVRADVESIQLYSRGLPITVEATAQKTHTYYGEVLSHEISFVLPPGDVALHAQGLPCPAGQGPAPRPRVTSSPQAREIKELSAKASSNAFVWNRQERVRERFWVESKILSKSTPRVLARKVADRFGKALRQNGATTDSDLVNQVHALKDSDSIAEYSDCWFFIDHPDRADDNAEHLYRHVLHNHPEINAVFALERDSGDWERLSAEGFRLIEYGTPKCMAIALSARVVLSSDAVEACMYPAPRRLFGQRQDQKFVFLQHGVTLNDISAWLRGKRIALCICATSDEYEAFAWKKSPYELQAPQLALTGFPRHDTLLEKARRRSHMNANSTAKQLLIIPTWRRDLKAALDAAESSEEAREVFRSSRFGDSWLRVLHSPRLLEAIERGKLQVNFLLHPNFKAGISKDDIPSQVNLLTVGEQSFQDMLVGCDMFLTDYSSLAFDVAYIDRPLAYFHFDIDTVGSGAHSWIPGYFDYDTMGLGPVLQSADSVDNWILDTLATECDVESLFEKRMNSTFVARDTNNSERAIQAVAAILGGEAPHADHVIRSRPPILGVSLESMRESIGVANA